MQEMTLNGSPVGSPVSVPGLVEDLFKYDASTDTFWGTNGDSSSQTNTVTNFSVTGQQISSMTIAGAGTIRGVTVDPADNTLWLIDQEMGNLIHTGRIQNSVMATIPLSGLNVPNPTAFVDLVRLPDGTFWMSNQGPGTIALYHVNATATAVLAGPIDVSLYEGGNIRGLDAQLPISIAAPVTYTAIGH